MKSKLIRLPHNDALVTAGNARQFGMRCPFCLVLFTIVLTAGVRASAQNGAVSVSPTDACVGDTFTMVVNPWYSCESEPWGTVEDSSGHFQNVPLSWNGDLGAYTGTFSESSAGSYTVSAADNCEDDGDYFTSATVNVHLNAPACQPATPRVGPELFRTAGRLTPLALHTI